MIGVVDSNGNVVNNNTIYGYSGIPFADGIVLVGASYNVVSGNAVSGYGSVGIFLDSASNSNAGINKVTPTNITTPLSNSGSGNTVTV